MQRPDSEQVKTAVAVEKLCDWADVVWAGAVCRLLLSFLGGERQGCCWLAEEAHQSLDVLRSCRQEELLPNELHAS